MLNFELSLAPVYFGGHGLNYLESKLPEDGCIVVSHTVASKFLRKGFQHSYQQFSKLLSFIHTYIRVRISKGFTCIMWNIEEKNVKTVWLFIAFHMICTCKLWICLKRKSSALKKVLTCDPNSFQNNFSLLPDKDKK